MPNISVNNEIMNVSYKPKRFQSLFLVGLMKAKIKKVNNSIDTNIKKPIVKPI